MSLRIEPARAPMSDTALLDALHARRGIVCFVGAGGKKTSLYRVAATASMRIGLTATAHIERFPEALGITSIVAPEAELLAKIKMLQAQGIIAYAQPSSKPDRFAGLSLGEVTRIHEEGRFELTLVKADGARGRLVKAPNDSEPLLPPNTSTVIPLLSIKALGSPLDERSTHRVERFAAVTGAIPGQTISTTHLARLLSSEEGALQSVGTAAVVPVINMVETAEQLGAAQTIARQALHLTQRYDRIVIASMRSPQPIVAIVKR